MRRVLYILARFSRMFSIVNIDALMWKQVDVLVIILRKERSKANNSEGTSNSPQTTTKSPQTIGKSGEGCSQSPKWIKSRVASDKGKPVCGFRLHDILDSNPRFTCRLDGEETSSGNSYFRRIYVCFKGVRDGWLAGCRKVIGLYGCFLKHTCRGKLLVAKGRDENNQMYPIAWAVVKQGNELTIIFDSHKGLLDVVSDWLPNVEHKKYTRHVFANFKKKFSGVQLQRLFWHAASTTLEQKIYAKMEEMKNCKNLGRHYHTIHRKRIELPKEEQRFWTVIPSGFQELEVRKGHEAYGVNIYLRTLLKRTDNLPLLPPIVRTMPGRPRKNIVKAKFSEKFSSKQSGQKDDRAPVPKPLDYATYAFARGGGRGLRVRRDGRGERSRGRGQTSGGTGQSSDGRGQRGGGREEESYDQESFNRKNVFTVNENVQTQESIVANMNDSGEIRFRLVDIEVEDNYMSMEVSITDKGLTIATSADKGKTVAETNAEATTKPKATKKGSKRKAASATEELPLRIYHKNRGRSERIFNQKMKKSGFGPKRKGQPLIKHYL
ncbi:hypothetical protein Tco_1045823 [Tanacetum coccineum]|uniref:Transposase n=1 Tax=Tanacetum coccineum TaxID=301880 RepID=A0ABQ5GU53_9ASTR